MTNDYPILNPKEKYLLWPGLILFLSLATLGFMSASEPPAYATIIAVLAAGVFVYLRRPDSPLRRLKIKRQIVAQTWQGAYIIGTTAPSGQLLALTEEALTEAIEDYARATGTKADYSQFRGTFVIFKPGLPGGPNSPATHYVYSGAYVTPGAMQIQLDPGADTRLVLNRVRYGALLRLDANLRAHAMEQDHRTYLESVGVDLRGIPL